MVHLPRQLLYYCKTQASKKTTFLDSFSTFSIMLYLHLDNLLVKTKY